MSLASQFWPPDPYEPHPQLGNRNVFLANFGEIAARVWLFNVHNLKLHLLTGRMLAEANYNLISKCLDLFLVGIRFRLTQTCCDQHF